MTKRLLSLARAVLVSRGKARTPLQAIAPGEGRVVRLDGAQIAAYRDPSGQLHTVSAVCTHLGCIVEFNDEQRTWDCPWHSARFAIDGTVVAGKVFTEEPLPPVSVAE